MVDVHKSVRIPLEDTGAHVTLVTSLNQTTETVKVSEIAVPKSEARGKRLVFLWL